jgi:FMN-dependent NADH-azoreductase
MSNILFVTSSPRRAASYSNQVAAELLMKLEESDPDAEVTVRDAARRLMPRKRSLPGPTCWWTS